MNDFEKLKEEINAAQSAIFDPIYAIINSAEDDADKILEHSTWILPIPRCDQFIAPMIYTIPLQLLAYYTAGFKGNDIDQPRNLAKSVTVE